MHWTELTEGFTTTPLTPPPLKKNLKKIRPKELNLKYSLILWSDSPYDWSIFEQGWVVWDARLLRSLVLSLPPLPGCGPQNEKRWCYIALHLCIQPDTFDYSKPALSYKLLAGATNAMKLAPAWPCWTVNWKFPPLPFIKSTERNALSRVYSNLLYLCLSARHVRLQNTSDVTHTVCLRVSLLYQFL